jgi:hypothetical protein
VVIANHAVHHQLHALRKQQQMLLLLLLLLPPPPPQPLPPLLPPPLQWCKKPHSCCSQATPPAVTALATAHATLKAARCLWSLTCHSCVLVLQHFSTLDHAAVTVAASLRHAHCM